jgi:hypothetical protein
VAFDRWAAQQRWKRPKAARHPGLAPGTLAFWGHRWHEDYLAVHPLFSPPDMPEYNGAIEAGNGALKTRTHDEAARRGRTGHWTADDTEAARHMANELTYPRGPFGPTRQECFRTSPRISLESRAAFGRSVEYEQTQERLKQGCPLDTDLGHPVQAHIDRVAIGRVLVEHGFPAFTRRSITPSIKSLKPLNISLVAQGTAE